MKDLYIETATVKGEHKEINDEMVHLAILGAAVLEQDPNKIDVDFDFDPSSFDHDEQVHKCTSAQGQPSRLLEEN